MSSSILHVFSKNTLTIDIISDTINFCQLSYHKKNNSILIEKYGNIKFSPKHIQDNMIKESFETVKIIRNFIEKERIDVDDVYINITTPSFTLRIVKVPKMSLSDLKDYLEIEISQFLPFDTETTVYNFKIINEIKEDNKPMMNVLLALAPKNIVNNYYNLFKNAGLYTAVIDFFPNTISRLFMNYKGHVAIINVNSNILDFIIIENGTLFMYSNVVLENSPDYSKTNHKNLSYNNFKEFLKEISSLIENYLNFFSSRHFGVSVNEIFLIGEICKIEDIKEHFEHIFSATINIGIGSIFDINFEPILSDINNRSILTSYACNIGLAIRGDD